MLFITPDLDVLDTNCGPAVRCTECGNLTRTPVRVLTGSPDCHVDCACGGRAELLDEPACSQLCADAAAARPVAREHEFYASRRWVAPTDS